MKQLIYLIIIFPSLVFAAAHKSSNAAYHEKFDREMAELDRQAAENDALFVRVNAKLTQLTKTYVPVSAKVKPAASPDDQSFARTLDSVIQQNEQLLARTTAVLDVAFGVKSRMQKECSNAMSNINGALAITQKMGQRQRIKDNKFTVIPVDISCG